MLFAYGDYKHCPVEDVDHNIRRLTLLIAANPKLTEVSKDYQSGVYERTERLDWERVKQDVEGVYRETLLSIDVRGNILGQPDEIAREG
ncbi:MAG: hypothetical protein HY365_01005 [Candidatus Aenigmarchaeota archaeon]|nr:hypothetical protein [Candidatus Aenigmarchaeota archaeon]